MPATSNYFRFLPVYSYSLRTIFSILALNWPLPDLATFPIMSRTSRVTAFKRLAAEYRTLTNDAPEGIVAGPRDEDDYFTWVAMFQGPEGTPFEGGVFEAELKFPEDYPLRPPEMRFLDKMWHPNGNVTPRAFPQKSLNMKLTSYKSTQMVKCVSRYYILPATIQITMNLLVNGGVRFRV